jgi:DNA-binding GntR family transcriptional regulator
MRIADVESPRDNVVRDIVRGLYEGRYAPGQRLVEGDLTAFYGVSRGPVREALNWLSAEGIVALTPQRGAQVRRLSKNEAIDILVIVESLVGLAARLAAGRITSPGAAQKLKRALKRLIEFDPSSGSPDHAHARDGFYGVLIEIGGNAELRRLMPRVLVHLIRVQYRSTLKVSDAVRHADYGVIAKAVLAAQSDRAETGARVHIARAVAALRDSRER